MSFTLLCDLMQNGREIIIRILHDVPRFWLFFIEQLFFIFNQMLSIGLCGRLCIHVFDTCTILVHVVDKPLAMYVNHRFNTGLHQSIRGDFKLWPCLDMN